MSTSGVAPTRPHPASDPDWLREKLAITDDTMVGEPPPRKPRPCDAPPGCNAGNCLGCGETPPGVQACARCGGAGTVVSFGGGKQAPCPQCALDVQPSAEPKEKNHG